MRCRGNCGLRSAFARLRVKQDRQDDARQILGPVYNRFTEGFETADCVLQARCFQSLPFLSRWIREVLTDWNLTLASAVNMRGGP